MSQHPTTRRARVERKGVALAIALVSIVILSLVSMGVFYASTQEYRISSNTMSQRQAAAAAELGQSLVMGSWNVVSGSTIAVGDTVRRDSTDAAGWGFKVVTTRLSTMTYWIVSEGWSHKGTPIEGRAKTGILMRPQGPQLNVPGSLTTAGPVKLSGTSELNGHNQNPPGWSCPTLTPDKPALVTSYTAGGNPKLVGGAIIDGSPAVDYNPIAADTSTYFSYGTMGWKDLTSMASKTFPAGTITTTGPVITGGACDLSVITNWGDPTRSSPGGVCESYFPIIYVAGDAHISSSGRGQGILLVEGDLDLSGGFEFFGIVIARGRVTSSGTGAHITGGVLAADADLDQNTIVGTSLIQYSGCAIEAALKASAQLRPVRQRAWTQVF
jgi:hypothetical protein